MATDIRIARVNDIAPFPWRASGGDVLHSENGLVVSMARNRPRSEGVSLAQFIADLANAAAEGASAPETE